MSAVGMGGARFDVQLVSDVMLVVSKSSLHVHGASFGRDVIDIRLWQP